jgi:hypothetical protein
MKTINLIVRQTEISKVFPSGLHLEVDDCASVLDVIRVADVKMKERCEKFPVREFTSLFQMVYHPHEDRFYRQVAVQAHARQNQFLNVRENPKMPLPDETTIILIPEGGCSSDWEEPVK